MSIAFVLVLVGLFSIWLEFYVPGGILAVIGGICIFLGLCFFMNASLSLAYSILFFVFTLLAVIIVVKLALKQIQRSGRDNSFLLSRDQEGYKGAAVEEDLVGKKGIAITDLGPSGYILIEGKRCPALCRGPYIDKGSEVIVLSQEIAHLIVRAYYKNDLSVLKPAK